MSYTISPREDTVAGAGADLSPIYPVSKTLPNAIEWVPGALDAPELFAAFCRGAEAVVHRAPYRPPGAGFRVAA
jgi:hypothetical protein